MGMRMRRVAKVFVLAACAVLAACVRALGDDAWPTWSIEDSSVFPAARGLARPEDGLALADGRVVVSDQAHGLRVIAADESTKPFGRFAEAGYVHAPPAQMAGPNGIALEPDGVHALVADVFTGAIYRVNLETEATERIYTHAFGVNTAVSDSTGAIWFTQSTQNASGPDSEARLFAPFDRYTADGALYRIAPPDAQGMRPPAQLVLDGLSFANGVIVDETRGALYVAETNGDVITAYRLSVETGALSERRVLASVLSPDNIELDEQGRVWVASPIQSAVLVIDPASGRTETVFRARLEGDPLVAEWRRRGDAREPRLELITPELWTPLPGLLTGIIPTPGTGPVYLTGIGDALVKLDR